MDETARGPVAQRLVTFLFSDVEGSTRLLQRAGGRYVELLETHRRLVRDVVSRHGGVEQDAEGDAFFVVFPEPRSGLAAAIDIQRRLATHPWPAGCDVAVRIGLHSGEATVVGHRHYGLDVHAAARICASAHGGQIVISARAAALVGDRLAAGVTLRDLGEHRLKDFDALERLFQVVTDGLRSDFPDLRTPRAVARLPVARTSFVGRELQLEEGRRQLARCRLLTLTGPGGSGKSRLALELAIGCAADFPDGVHLVPLAPVGDPGLVGASITHALGLADDGRMPVLDLLADRLHDRRTLLVMDNFEHLLAGADLVGHLLDRAPRLAVLVTSRAPLHLYGEQIIDVPPLDLPDPREVELAQASATWPGLRLFVERAREVSPDFTLGPDNVADVVALCHRLDGLPLAIELAASRLRLFSPAEMTARLGSSLELPGLGPRDLPARLQSLTAAIAWSDDLLAGSTSELFRRMSVFRGGIDVDLVRAVCPDDAGDVFASVAELVDHSLLRSVGDGAGLRVTMLETIREYAAERLTASGEERLYRERHAGALLTLAETAAARLSGRDCGRWLDRLQREHDNLRAALAWFCDEGEAEEACRLVSALWRFWQTRGHLAEARQRTEQVLRMLLPELDPRRAMEALEAAAAVAYWQGDTARAESLYRDCLTRSTELADRGWVARSSCNLAYALRGTGAQEEALAVAQQALTGFRETGDLAGAASALRLTAIVLAGRGELDEAARAAELSRSLFEQLDRPLDLAWALRQVGMIHLRRGELAAARNALRDALRLFVDVEDTGSMPVLLADLAAVARARGDLARADELDAAATSLQARSGADWADVVDRLEQRPARSAGADGPGGATPPVDDVVREELRG